MNKLPGDELPAAGRTAGRHEEPERLLLGIRGVDGERAGRYGHAVPDDDRSVDLDALRQVLEGHGGVLSKSRMKFIWAAS